MYTNKYIVDVRVCVCTVVVFCVFWGHGCGGLFVFYAVFVQCWKLCVLLVFWEVFVLFGFFVCFIGGGGGGCV